MIFCKKKNIYFHFTSKPENRITRPELTRTRITQTRLTRTLNGLVIGSIFPREKPEQPDPKNLKPEEKTR
ncbi:hypothetical protein HanIR_Chr02g0094111 [Helianthus annuus]|nr:hypothetical protein HanIR_Chr02g0094111 [Helianthus annuus]